MEKQNKSLLTLSIDWEDFGQLICKYNFGIVTPPKNTIDRQTGIILDMLDETNNKATFFVLGMLASYRPDLVKAIAARGHEIALHGHNHLDMRKLDRQQVKEDLDTAMDLITNITGTPIFGFRAPFFSIDKNNLYILEILAELGLEYDSSIFPIKLPRYGIHGFDIKDKIYKLPNGHSIVELPLTVGQYFGKKIPVCGGGYMRIMPKFLVHKVFNDLRSKEMNGMIYMHPYEFDTKNIDVASNFPAGSIYSRSKAFSLNIRWNLFRNSIRNKIRMLLKQHIFVTCLEKANYVKNNGNSSILLGCTE
jgi:polysaccharide deacetylase family protein (PEP-CTERM system associated)